MAGEKVVLGIDVGTSGTKVIAVSVDGKIISSATSEYGMSTPQPGFAEQNPDTWWSATVVAVKSVIQKSPGIRVQGIGFSGQMHGLVPLDKNGQVIRPAIIWCDLRSAKQAAQLEHSIGREHIIQMTQNPPLPNFTLTKLVWMKDNEPQLYDRIEHILLPKDFVRYKMTGAYAIDAADASGTLMFDVANRKWSEDMCKATAIDMRHLPDVYESNEIVGQLSVEAAQVLGLSAGIPIVAGAGDQAAGAIGLGVVRPGTISAVYGTSGVVLAVTEEPLRDPLGRLHTFCHAQPNSWFVMGVTQAAGGSLQWYRNILGQAEQVIANRTGSDAYTLLMEEASAAPPGADGLIFLPYLMGERSPHLNPTARGAWIGLEWRHHTAHLVRAILEGVAFSLRDCWEVMREIGVEATQWKVSGGGAQGQLWMEIFASVLREQVEILQSSHGPALGAAILAAQGIGVLSESPASLDAWMGPGGKILPNGDWSDFYIDLYPVFNQAYQSTKSLVQNLTQLSGRF